MCAGKDLKIVIRAGPVSPLWQRTCLLSAVCVNFWAKAKWMSFHTLHTHKHQDFLHVPKFKMMLNGRLNYITEIQAKSRDALAGFQTMHEMLRIVTQSLGSTHKVLRRQFWWPQRWSGGKCCCWGEINSVRKPFDRTTYMEHEYTV
jgi:hypothetical protein